MKILIAPQAFKGSFSAQEVAAAIKQGVDRFFPSSIILPVADGGEGFLEAMMTFSRSYRKNTVTGPFLRENIDVAWGITNDGTAVIELAKVCGLSRILPQMRNPLMTTTYGVGELMRAALDEGIRQFFIGIGDSGTHDGGMGIIQALGGRFLNGEGNPLPPLGESLIQLHRIDLQDLDPRIRNARIVIGCDVINPLTGSNGAAHIYSRQKGATPEMVDTLEEGLCRFAAVVAQQYGIHLAATPGAGAAGGVGGGLHALLGAALQPGIDLVLQNIHFDTYLEGVDLVITGEGCMDKQTTFYKAPMGVARWAKKKKIPVVAIVGSFGEESIHEQGIDAVIPLSFFPSEERAPLSCVEMAAQQVARLLTLRK